jgi:hypothetical protein
MAKNLTDNFKGSKFVGTTVKLTPTDLAKTPEAFERLYDRRRQPRRAIEAPRPTLKEIENTNLNDRLSEFGLNEEIR